VRTARAAADLRAPRPLRRPALCSARRTLHTGAGLLTDEQTTRLDALFANDTHVHLEATWRIYQQMTSAYRDTDRTAGLRTMSTLIDALSIAVPTELTELITLGRTLKRRAADVLAYFTRPANNGRLEHLCDSAPRLPQPHQLHRHIAARGRGLDHGFTLDCEDIGISRVMQTSA